MLFLLLWGSFAVSKADSQEKDTEMEVDDVFWNTRIVPVLQKLEKGSTNQSLF